MYSLNFVFGASNSFFSPDVVTSGFTGSGGFSLLWGPFVQPWERELKSCYIGLTKQRVRVTEVTIDTYETEHNGGGTERAEIGWLKQKQKTYSNAKEVWEVSSSSLAAGPSLKKDRHIKFKQILNSVSCGHSLYAFLPSKHRGTPGPRGERCNHL